MRIKRRVLSLLCFLICLNCYALIDDQNDLKKVSHFITTFKSKDINQIASVIQFPLTVDPLLPKITDKATLQQRFAEVFDQKLLDLIINSNPKQDWSHVGWRGIMLGNGEVWIQNDGKLYGLNYQTKLAKKLRRIFVNEQRQKIYSSLKNFADPVLQWNTHSFLVRVDEMSNKQFRLTLWPRVKDIGEKPMLVLNDGKINWQGTGGDHDYIFKDKAVTYRVEVRVLGGEPTNTDRLVKLLGEKELLSDPITNKIFGN